MSKYPGKPQGKYQEKFVEKYKENQKSPAAPEPEPIPIDGFQQVLDMLKIADPAFRESLLRRLALRDQELVNSLRKDLGNLEI
jgi:hypothetical protein